MLLIMKIINNENEVNEHKIAKIGIYQEHGRTWILLNVGYIRVSKLL